RDHLHRVARVARTVPQHEEARGTGNHDIELAGKQSVVQQCRAAYGLIRDVEAIDSLLLRVFFEQLLLLHDIDLQVADAELAADPDFGRFAGRGAAKHECDEGADRGCGDAWRSARLSFHILSSA